MDNFIRSFLKILPSIRNFNHKLAVKGPLKADSVDIPCKGRIVNVQLHRASGGKRPVLFEMHGGGFLLGDAQKDDFLCDKVKNILNCAVIGINYRLAPEYPYPAALDDAYEVICYVKDHAEEFGIDPERMAVMGYSAGATLSTGCAMRCVKSGEFSLCAQVLHYPYLDSTKMPSEKKHFACDMDSEVMRAFTVLYSTDEQRSNAYVSPVCAANEDLAGTAPALLLMAQNDSLCDEGIQYAEMLKSTGVEVIARVVPDAHHGYIEDWCNPACYAEVSEETKATYNQNFMIRSQEAIEESCFFLKKQFDE